MKKYLLPLLCLLLIACQTTPDAPAMTSQPADWISRVGNWPGPAEYRIQLVTFIDGHNQETHLIRYDVSLSSKRLVLAAQTTLGLPIYESTLADGELTVQRHISQLDDVPLDQVIADFLLANWPLAQLAVALQETGDTIVSDENGRRVLDRQGALKIEIRHSPGGKLRIVHHDIPLEVTIQTLEQRIVDS